ncbi:MAG: LacI family DNA-binding transcriptional regulator [Chthonomonadetes bacterium]|nr:LacI family DNA-binding transcriptional regulator [Chthonomonadetes bacterium]
MRRHQANMDTIAQQVGVSKTTVYRALHNTGRIHPATRQRILEVARSLGYRPNLVARSLRTRRTATIGVVTVGLTGWFYAHVLEGIDKVAYPKQHGVLIAHSDGYPERERSVIEMLIDKRVDGLIVAPCDPQENLDLFQQVLEMQIPLVFIDRYIPSLPVSFVGTNNEEGGYIATKHLLDMGRRRIAFVSTASRERRATSVIQRFNGYRRALREAGIEEALELGPGMPDILPEERYAYDVVDQFLKNGSRFDAVFAVNDDLAYGAMRAIQAHGLRIPEDVAVVGFDNQDTSAYVSPPLTTVAQPMVEIGEQAAKLLFERIEQRNSALVRHILLSPQLVVRESSCANHKNTQEV